MNVYISFNQVMIIWLYVSICFLCFIHFLFHSSSAASFDLHIQYGLLLQLFFYVNHNISSKNDNNGCVASSNAVWTQNSCTWLKTTLSIVFIHYYWLHLLFTLFLLIKCISNILLLLLLILLLWSVINSCIVSLLLFDLQRIKLIAKVKAVCL